VKVLEHGALIQLTASQAALMYLKDATLLPLMERRVINGEKNVAAEVLSSGSIAEDGSDIHDNSTREIDRSGIYSNANEILHEGQRLFVEVLQLDRTNIRVGVVSQDGIISISKQDAEKFGIQNVAQSMQQPLLSEISTELRKNMFPGWKPIRSAAFVVPPAGKKDDNTALARARKEALR
jgi:hypothetical protein